MIKLLQHFFIMRYLDILIFYKKCRNCAMKYVFEVLLYLNRKGWYNP